MKKILTFALCLLATSPAFCEWINMKNLKVAVLDVVSRVPEEKIDTATLTEMLQVALVDRREFQIVERSLLSKILKEQEFQLSGMTDGQAAKVGALAGADKVMTLSVAKISDRYIFIVKGVDSNTGIVDLTDQVMSYTVGGLIDLFPVMADRLIRKARGENLPAFQLAPKDMTNLEAPPTIILSGVYRAQGTNPDGSLYRGTCEITPQGDGSYEFEWNVGTSHYLGTGTLSGSLMTVEWGASSPVWYNIRQGGKVLEGTWSSGQGTETLTR